MLRLHDKLGGAAQPQDFPEDDLTPEFSYYADGNEDGFTGCPDEVEPVEIPTPEASDNYVGVSIQLPRGPDMALGRVTKRARDNDGNVEGRAHDNPILDTRKYVVEFDDGEEAELAANVIAESMYAQCDPVGNQYVMFDAIVDYRKGDSALAKADQIAYKADGRTFMRRSTK